MQHPARMRVRQGVRRLRPEVRDPPAPLANLARRARRHVGRVGLDEAVERINANGGKVVMGPMEVPGGSWVCQAVDPQGAHFALISLQR